MSSLRLSIKTNLILTILFVGLLGFGLALVSTNVYRDVILDYKRQSIIGLIKIKTLDQIAEIKSYSRDLGNTLNKQTAFKQALLNNDSARLKQLLAQQFHQYFVTAHILKLERLLIFSNKFKPLAQADSAETTLKQDGSVCTQLIELASKRRGSSRLQPVGRLCNYNGHPYFSFILPLGGLVPKGYLEVVTTPSHGLESIADDLGMPVQLRLPNGDLLFRTQKWPESSSNGLIATYQLKTTSQEEPAILIDAYDDNTKMYADLKNTRNTLLLISTAIIGLVMLVALYLLRRTLVRPLDVLNKQLQRLHTNNKLLGEPINVQSNIIEVNDLVDDFNQMAAELHTLYRRLEHMAYTDSMTKLPNRGLFNEYVDYLIKVYKNQSLALFLIDLDNFKTVNDRYGHEAGDILLCETAKRMNSVLRSPEFSETNGISLAEISGYDLLVRLGGDEFAVVMPNIETRQEVEEIADKLVKICREPIQLSSENASISVSIGIALYPYDGLDRSTLLRYADTAMYQSKNQGLGYCFHSRDKQDTPAIPDEV